MAIRRSPEPRATVKAYKLFRTDPKRPGQIFPLFVNAQKAVPIGRWIDAEVGPQTDTGKVKSKLGPLAYRPGWHAGDLPIATHIGGKTQRGLKAPDFRPSTQVWAEVEMPADVDWQSRALAAAKRNKAGAIIANTAHITDQLPVGGHYRYKTNPNMTGEWLIAGSMKVNRILSDDEVVALNRAAGLADLPRLPGDVVDTSVFVPARSLAALTRDRMPKGSLAGANRRLLSALMKRARTLGLSRPSPVSRVTVSKALRV